MTSPVRISWRARLSSKRSAKLSSKEGVALDIDGKIPVPPWDGKQGRFKKKSAGAHAPARLRSTGELPTLLDEIEHESHGLLDVPFGGVEQRRIRQLHQGRHGAGGVSRIPFPEVLQKALHVSSQTLFDQLLIAPFGTCLGRGGEEHLDLGVGEDHRAHVAPLGDQPGRCPIVALTVEQGTAHRRQHRHPGGTHRARLGADLVGHVARVALAEQHARTLEARRKRARQRSHAGLVVQRHARAHRSERGQAVERSAVQVMPAQGLGHARGHRPLARSRGTVDGQHRHRPGDLGEGLEIAREGLVDTFRVVDAHPTAAEADEREAHRHAMVVVGVDRRRTKPLRRRDHQVVGALLHFGAHLAQLGRHRRDAVGLLDPPARDVAQPARPVGEQRGHRQRHRRIGDVVEVEIESLQRPACGPRGLDPVVAHRDARTELLERLGEAHVTLDAAPADALHPHRPAADRPSGEEVRRRRSIALDEHRARAAVARAAGHDEARPAVLLDLHAEARHQLQGDADVGLGDELADDLDGSLDTGQRQRHQERGEELAGDIAAHAHHAAGADGRRFQVQRRVALVGGAGDVGAELAQRIDQIADRTLVHARHTRQTVFATRQRKRRRERAEGGTRVAEEEVRALDRERAAHAAYAIVEALALAHPGHAERAQRLEHALDVVGHEQIADVGLAFGKRGEQQHAVRDALRAGQTDRTGSAQHRGQIEKFHHGLKKRVPPRRTRKTAAPAQPPFRPAGTPRTRKALLGGAHRQALGPGVACAPRALEHRLEPVAVALDQHHAQAREFGEIGVELFEQGDPVGDADVAPHLGVTAGDAGEVAKTARRMREQQRRIAAPGQIIHQSKSEQVRQMADGGEHAVVLLRRHADHHRTAGFPSGANLLHRFAPALGQRRQHHLAPDVELGKGRLHAALFGAGNRVCRDHVGQHGTEVAMHGVDHVALGAAGIGDDRAWFEVRRHRREDRIGLSDRRREQHQIGAVERARPLVGDLVDHAERARTLEHFAPAPHADDALDDTRAPQRERKRTADQTDAADDELADSPHHPAPVTRAPGAAPR